MTQERMTLVLPAEAHKSFVDLCKELRSMGATRVEAFGCVASFGPAPAPPPAPREEPEPPRFATREAAELHERARKILGGSQ